MLVVSFVVVVRQSLQEPRGQGGRGRGSEFYFANGLSQGVPSNVSPGTTVCLMTSELRCN